MAPTYTTAAEVYRLSGMDSTLVPSADVDLHIEDAEAWLDEHLHTTFKAGGQSVTEYLDGTGDKAIFVSWFGKVFRDAQPFVTISSLVVDGVTVTPSKVYVYPYAGKLYLKDTAEVAKFTATKPQSVVITYTYGHSAIPRVIKQLTGLIAALQVLAEKMGGTFNSVNSYTLPEYSVNKGDQVAKLATTFEHLKLKVDYMLAEITPTPSCA